VLRTIAAVTSNGGPFTVKQNVDRYGERTIAKTTQTTSLTEPAEYAAWLASEFGTPLTDATLQLRVGESGSNAVWAAALNLDLLNLVNVENIPVGGGAANDYDMFVQTITYNIRVKDWEVSLGLSNAERQRPFVLNDATLGKLDGPGLLSW
jgi:hypothetical protein